MQSYDHIKTDQFYITHNLSMKADIHRNFLWTVLSMLKFMYNIFIAGYPNIDKI